MTHDQIIQQFGAPSAAARGLHITLQTLRNWKRDGIPLRSQQWIESVTGGKLKASGKRKSSAK